MILTNGNLTPKILDSGAWGSENTRKFTKKQPDSFGGLTLTPNITCYPP